MCKFDLDDLRVLAKGCYEDTRAYFLIRSRFIEKDTGQEVFIDSYYTIDAVFSLLKQVDEQGSSLTDVLDSLSNLDDIQKQDVVAKIIRKAFRVLGSTDREVYIL